MISIRILMLSICWTVLYVPSICARDLSKYRDFQIGMSLPAVAEQTGMIPAQAKLIHERPAVIQELEWRPEISVGSQSSTDPVNEILFGFYNNQLYRIVINYSHDHTAGLSNQDLVEGISAKYGKASMPAATIISSSSSQKYSDNEKVIARWEDSQYSLSFFHFSYTSSFGMLLFSKRLDVLTQTAIAESIRLNDLEAPQREIERQRKQEEEKLAAGQKVRAANKANFRPLGWSRVLLVSIWNVQSLASSAKSLSNPPVITTDCTMQLPLFWRIPRAPDPTAFLCEALWNIQRFCLLV